MAKLTCAEMRTKTMVLDWLTQNRWNALSTENKIKIYLKVYDKAVPTKIIGDKDNPIVVNVNFNDLSESELVHNIRTRLPEICTREFDLAQSAN